MLPLRLAIIWHQHQPYYKSGKEYLLPWTRLHGVKDYLDMAIALEQFPDIKATINLVPSLLLQIKDYVENDAQDKVLRLSRIHPKELTTEDKRYVLHHFFLCNADRMILPYSRYNELYMKSGKGLRPITDEILNGFEERDWRDLQVWYCLTWIGPYSKEKEPFLSLLNKGSDFSEAEKHEAFSASQELLTEIIPTYARLFDSGQVDLSVSPFYHPILPLLCSTSSALEAMPEARLPQSSIEWERDASLHIEGAIQYFQKLFGRKPSGMWPSEGSISQTTLNLTAQHGINWVASDQEVLNASLGDMKSRLSHCFLGSYEHLGNDVKMFFRDHDLSDKIGFVYSKWPAMKAAQDFVDTILGIRDDIAEHYGEQALRNSVLPVILDGENCWEYYEENGRPFLEALYGLLSETSEITTVTCNQVLSEQTIATELDTVAAGSWIGGNFKIWIGGDEENRAWDVLAETREYLMRHREQCSDEAFFAAYEELLIAQGSDWFWWYGDENNAANDHDFDALFREHLRNVYAIIGHEYPDHLDIPICQTERKGSDRDGGGAMHRADFSE